MPFRGRFTGAFDAETVQALATAFDAAWTEYARTDSAKAQDALAQFACEVLARRIVQMGEPGERELIDDAVAHLRQAVAPRA